MKICYLIERRKFNERNMFNQSFRKKTVLCVMKEVDCIISRVMMKGCTSFGFVDKWSVSYLVAYYTLAQIYGIFMNEKKPKQLKERRSIRICAQSTFFNQVMIFFNIPLILSKMSIDFSIQIISTKMVAHLNASHLLHGSFSLYMQKTPNNSPTNSIECLVNFSDCK